MTLLVKCNQCGQQMIPWYDDPDRYACLRCGRSVIIQNITLPAEGQKPTELPKTKEVLKKWAKVSPHVAQAYHYIHHLSGEPDDILSVLIDSFVQQNQEVMKRLADLCERIPTSLTFPAEKNTCDSSR